MFLFGSFIRTRVGFHGRSISIISLGCSTSGGAVLFQRKRRVVRVAGPTRISAIVVKGHGFIPINEKFCRIMYEGRKIICVS